MPDRRHLITTQDGVERLMKDWPSLNTPEIRSDLQDRIASDRQVTVHVDDSGRGYTATRQ